MHCYSILCYSYKRWVLLIGACLLVLLKINSQQTNPDMVFSDTGFIFNVVPEIRDQKIVLVNTLHPYTVREISSYLDNDTLFEAFNANISPRNAIVLTQDERKAIKKELQLLQKVTWRKDFPANVQIIKRDTIDHIFSDKSRGWEYYHAVYGRKFYSFSKPIFLKERNLCIFYYDYACGSLCGYGLLAIYKKEGNEWKLYYALTEWVS